MLGPLIAFGLLRVAAGAFDAVFVVSFCFALLGLGVLTLFVENRPPRRGTRPARRPSRCARALGLLGAPPVPRRWSLAGAALGLADDQRRLPLPGPAAPPDAQHRLRSRCCTSATSLVYFAAGGAGRPAGRPRRARPRVRRRLRAAPAGLRLRCCCRRPAPAAAGRLPAPARRLLRGDRRRADGAGQRRAAGSCARAAWRCSRPPPAWRACWPRSCSARSGPGGAWRRPLAVFVVGLVGRALLHRDGRPDAEAQRERAVAPTPRRARTAQSRASTRPDRSAARDGRVARRAAPRRARRAAGPRGASALAWSLARRLRGRWPARPAAAPPSPPRRATGRVALAVRRGPHVAVPEHRRRRACGRSALAPLGGADGRAPLPACSASGSTSRPARASASATHVVTEAAPSSSTPTLQRASTARRSAASPAGRASRRTAGYGAMTVFVERPLLRRRQLLDRDDPDRHRRTAQRSATSRSSPSCATARASRRADFNFWGVTFARDGNRFYATLGTGGKTYLVEGDVAARQAARPARERRVPVALAGRHAPRLQEARRRRRRPVRLAAPRARPGDDGRDAAGRDAQRRRPGRVARRRPDPVRAARRGPAGDDPPRRLGPAARRRRSGPPDRDRRLLAGDSHRRAEADEPSLSPQPSPLSPSELR